MNSPLQLVLGMLLVILNNYHFNINSILLNLHQTKPVAITFIEWGRMLWIYIMPRKDYTGANRPHVNKVKSVDVQSLKRQHLILRQLNMCVWT